MRWVLHSEEGDMPTVKMVLEDEATGRVKEIYDEIMVSLGIDFVPNMYKLMATKPGFLEANWHRVKAIMVEPGRLDQLTREIIAVAVSAVVGCEY
jgi:alkylhydroperoxidase/carboxymuconolactone decarboxylase family protein YurZ